MRLIDADLFMDFIKEELKQDRPDDFHIRNIIRILEDLPTAYDVDKIVEHLEELKMIHQVRSSHYLKQGCEDLGKKHLIKFNAYHKAIEIVKAGGIDESNEM